MTDREKCRKKDIPYSITRCVVDLRGPDGAAIFGQLGLPLLWPSQSLCGFMGGFPLLSVNYEEKFCVCY